MTVSQGLALGVLIIVVGLMISGRFRPDVVALAGAGVLLGARVVRPVEVQAAFASPALIALASLFVIAYAMELSGLLGLLIRGATRLCSRLGPAGIWIIIALAGGLSAFLNNTPIVVLASPVIKEAAQSMSLSPRRFLIPLSYATILGGGCTLIGTSTNLLVNDMARNAGQPAFGLFEIAPVGLILAATGAVYLLIFGRRLLADGRRNESLPDARPVTAELGGDPRLFPLDRPFRPVPAFVSLAVFTAAIAAAALGFAPIAAAAFCGAVLLVLLRVISPDDAYRGLRPEILLLIAGMVVIGLSVELTGLASAASDLLTGWVTGLDPRLALALLYGATLFLTEILSNAAVAVLITPLAVALAQSLDVSARPFLVAVMMAASAAFATPFGYQTNVLAYQTGGYRYMDFVRIGVPLNLLTWAVGVAAIPYFFPF